MAREGEAFAGGVVDVVGMARAGPRAGEAAVCRRGVRFDAWARVGTLFKGEDGDCDGPQLALTFAGATAAAVRWDCCDCSGSGKPALDGDRAALLAPVAHGAAL